MWDEVTNILAAMGTLLNSIGDFFLEKAIAAESRRAGLVRDSLQLSFGDVEFLRSANSASGALSEALVLLHGAAADKTSWLRFAQHLKSGLPLIIPDLPGHGKSVSDIGLDYGIQYQAARLKEFLAALGIKRAHLIGNSMGGAIAIQLAATSPALVASLVLIDTAGADVTPSWLRQHVEKTGINPMLEVRDASDYRAMMRIGMEAPPYIPGIMVSALAREFVKRTAINRKIAEDIAQDLDQTAHLPKITTPTLILWGAMDKIFHVDNAEFLHREITNSRKIVMEKVGHVPMVEAPKEVALVCSEFFRDVVE
ncbi:alpha/beta fold hydrolase [Denitrobaculum tricleocarpae]|uniref:Alpha/beta hydrolase n=1 Tax=Denitrobaculum tricleocarpae TaxID=2591009 RepID=A0A545T7R5_9PROT|nr:alpha/beta hydrolase [Denitrobaculum tricleocarpae]TQV73267.1 alpha/beta hydrolase [Denitrobaculum tricleocarpae]